MYGPMLKLFEAAGGGGSTAIQQGLTSACGNSCNTTTLPDLFGVIANILVFVVGAISVIMIIIGGLRYAISNGDSKATGDAKNTILYAVIGLVVAIAAYAIVFFVNSHFAK